MRDADQRQTGFRQRDLTGRRLIHIAAERGDEAVVKDSLDEGDDPNSLIDTDLSDPNYNNPDNGQTPLHRAAWGGSLETVKLLLDRGSYANTADKRGNTALHVAADMGCGEVAERLCEARVSVNVPGRNGLTPLHYAALSGHYDVAEILITRKATIDAKDSKIGWTPLHCAADNGLVSMIELLLYNGAKANETDDKVGWTPLHFAAMSGHTAAVEKLIEKADINKEDKNGFTPLIFAAINGHISVVETLIGHGATINNTTFDWSSENVRSSKSVVEWLTMNGEKFRAKISSARWGRLYLAAMDGYTKTIRLVVDDKTYISEERVGNADMLLHWAARDGRLRTVRLLIQIGTNRGVKDDHGQTPLWWAAMAGYGDVVQALFEHIDTEARNRLLASAVQNGYEVAVRTLIRAGANPEVHDSQEETLLFQAVRKGNAGIIRALCETGATIEAATNRRDTPLSLAATIGKGEAVIQTLLEAGANLETTDKYGCTPLMAAANSGQKGAIQILLKAGANLEAADRWETTVLRRRFRGGMDHPHRLDRLFWAYALLAVPGLPLRCPSNRRCRLPHSRGQTARAPTGPPGEFNRIVVAALHMNETE